jgi:hypothetical protein
LDKKGLVKTQDTITSKKEHVMTKVRLLAGLLLIGCTALVIGGCSSNYYYVKDPVNGQSFYTDEIDEMSGGAIKFTDQRTGNTVIIQNSVIKEINEQEYNTGKTSAK